MYWADLFSALALVLVLEGMLPFISPSNFKRTLLAVLQLEERALRIIGLLSMVFGAVLLYVVRA
ncbi:MAG: DUF2065 domain-containing protein [Gammaproteobacteria bacterium]